MDEQVDDDPPPPAITDEQHCLHLHGIDKEIRIFAARKDTINQMLEIERSTPALRGNDEKARRGALHAGGKDKDPGRPAEPVIRPSKFTAKANKNLNAVQDFVFPKKTAKNTAMEKNEHVNASNSFAVLNAANEDAEDVIPPPYKIKPIFMRLTPNYNLILQEINRTHPTA
ncbi:uncharacterized protein TNIN_358931 [Trichonephila inaurata madagascariensis]|uniref:Uncharacterized protein n=1 Tax=Trichonephila inaurata madagascariensis TaxID=2747483 RepID=A0A8X6WYF0_9ARAC|nr:uncharacterized protein TNIN_358931 [Trichonephila inaurata madagascariensis]